MTSSSNRTHNHTTDLGESRGPARGETWRQGDFMIRPSSQTVASRATSTTNIIQTEDFTARGVRRMTNDSDLITLDGQLSDLTFSEAAVRKLQLLREIAMKWADLCYGGLSNCQHEWMIAFAREGKAPTPRYSEVTKVCVKCYTTNAWVNGDIVSEVSTCQHHFTKLLGIRMCKGCHITDTQLPLVRMREGIEKTREMIERYGGI